MSKLTISAKWDNIEKNCTADFLFGLQFTLGSSYIFQNMTLNMTLCHQLLPAMHQHATVGGLIFTKSSTYKLCNKNPADQNVPIGGDKSQVIWAIDMLWCVDQYLPNHQNISCTKKTLCRLECSDQR